ncbi:MAG: preprotein translocase subunit SecE [Candidatus Staskawiczbacteria bacterium]|nr:preprotein translocase subunit SecE [Candidatus Staskawiczbacteria bacterium]
MTSFHKKIWEFFKEVKTELYKVTWPTKNETLRYTVIIIGLSLIFAVFFGGFDLLIQYGINQLII